ncbi:2-C-methyl-D-erythritol 4-phosphate cytidylyltransferase [Neobacillus terrae]|uniref:2-C-methyl-D-erythritol 4-phosphate cytidylyltransferase n=1 Tax=Neobacillus terrae TaxID=3034837 RepID=UPI00140E5613|nr:2-C-methyl-D-erythritol 4-phosphate cytidylyltransferase [Neobacillus terrae]NHM33349.1 2-C-methyl-D-erythritol 4-phosphate cytidylyltransferase [Neobacillus terrae]
MSYQVILPAAGQGKRMGAGKNKLLLELDGIPLLIHTLKVFEKDPDCEKIILAINPQDEIEFKGLIEQFGLKKIDDLVPGGKERQQSIHNALKTVEKGEMILVHDAARPFIQTDAISRLTEKAGQTGAAILAVPVKDTIKKAENGEVTETVDRSSLWAVQTPQAFRISILQRAYELAEEDDFLGTDDASLVERLPHPVSVLEGDYDNIKLTTPEDLFFAEAILKKREAAK